LGTGSALPSKYRNVTGIYFEPGVKAGILLDAGEGTYGQLYRRFGSEIDEIITRLQAVWISHVHADHHLGLIRIMHKRMKLLPSSSTCIMIVGPRLVGKWLTEYSSCVSQPLEYTFVDCVDMCSPQHAARPFFKGTFGFVEFFNIEVLHCPEAYAAIISHQEGWKLVYSGDTRMCAELEKAGQGATVLIHEATFEDGLEEDAHSKGHSTTKEAVLSGIRMNAKWILLTHFSQRYPKLPVLEENVENRVGIAFDLMHVRWSALPKLPKLLPLITQLFNTNESKKTNGEKCI